MHRNVRTATEVSLFIGHRTYLPNAQVRHSGSISVNCVGLAPILTPTEDLSYLNI